MKPWPMFMVLARTILLLLTSLLMVAGFAAAGQPDPWAAYLPWWPYQVILVNIVTFFLLKWLTRKEGTSLNGLIGYRRSLLKQDLLLSGGLLIPAFVAGSIGLYGLSFLLWGTMPPGTMFQPLPMAAALIAAIAFPLTNAVVETTTYMGYALPRLEASTKSQWGALLLAAAGLSIQHVAIPLLLDGRFLIWRLFAFLPLALFVGVVYSRIRRLTPLIIVHFVMDLQLAATVLMVSLPH